MRVVAGAVVAEPREELASALTGWATPEQTQKLVDEVLAITKRARGWCPECSKQVWVDIPDAKSVSSALVELANQAWGRPDTASGDGGGIVFKRLVRLDEEEPVAGS